MEIIYLESTISDFLWIRKYYEQVFPDGAKNAIHQFELMEELLLANPYLGRKKYDEVRMLKIPKTPFSYRYRVTETHIEVLRVWDDRQQD